MSVEEMRERIGTVVADGSRECQSRSIHQRQRKQTSFRNLERKTGRELAKRTEIDIGFALTAVKELLPTVRQWTNTDFSMKTV
jgi:hypothetical protein